MKDSGGDVTQLLAQISHREPGAEERLVDVIYGELKKLAASQMRGERSDHTLSPTALANEAWLRFAPDVGGLRSRQQFFSIAVTAMRRILIEHARSRHAAKRGGDGGVIRLENLDEFATPSDEQMIALDESLTALSAIRPRAARVVELRFFGGFTHEDIATMLDVERRTVDRDWAFARAWLFDYLRRDG